MRILKKKWKTWVMQAEILKIFYCRSVGHLVSTNQVLKYPSIQIRVHWVSAWDFLLLCTMKKKTRMKLNQRKGWMRNWWFALPEIVTAPANNTIEWRMSLSIPIVCQVCECTRVRFALRRVLTFAGQGDAKCSSQMDPVNTMWKHCHARQSKKHPLTRIRTDTFGGERITLESQRS